MSYVLCFHRWAGRQARYENYPLPLGTTVHFFCSAEAVNSLPIGSSFTILNSLDDFEEVSELFQKAIYDFGRPEKILSFNEADALTAARLRESSGISGRLLEDVAPFRDKLKMANVASRQSSVRVLSTYKFSEMDLTSCNSFSFPLVVKPRYGTASLGVQIVEKYEELVSISLSSTEDLILQEFCPADTVHIDGWWDGDAVVFGKASAYTNNCSSFGVEGVLGSCEYPRGPSEDLLIEASRSILEQFSPGRQMVFHLELFISSGEVIFLEIASRAGGAEIPFLWREIHNIDLIGIDWEIQTGWGSDFRVNARERAKDFQPDDSQIGGWLLSQISPSIPFPRSAYWFNFNDIHCERASGVYEGANLRIRFRGRFDNVETDINNMYFDLRSGQNEE